MTLRVDVQRELLGKLGDSAFDGTHVQDTFGGAQHHVLGHGEGGYESELLMDHPHTRRQCIGGTGEHLAFTEETNFALLRAVDAGKDVHQRRLACAVLAKDSVDAAPLDSEFSTGIGDNAGEPFGDSCEFYSKRGSIHWCVYGR